MIDVKIFYPTDPLADIPGGIDTCIRDTLRYAPEDISLTLVGVTTDNKERPVGRTSECELDGRAFKFVPVSSFETLKKQLKIPLSLRYTLAMLGKGFYRDADVLQFHRIEPAFPYLWRSVPKIFIQHQNMNILHNDNADIRWKFFPGAYFALEDLAMPRAERTFVVRRDGVEDYQAKYPNIADRFDFLPTWMNPKMFYPLPEPERIASKAKVVREYSWDADDFIFLTVGRIDHQKNHAMLVDAFAKLKQRVPQARLLIVGDGVLRNSVEEKIAKLNLQDCVKILGVLGQPEVARLLRSADAKVLSSAYEGMPRCVVEALGCGLPAVTTDVGEVRRVVHDGVNGIVIEQHSADVLADAMYRMTQERNKYAGNSCTDAVHEYTAPVILEKLYDTYRDLKKQSETVES